MLKPSCDCLRRVLNQYEGVEGMSGTAQVYYLNKGTGKGYEDCGVFLISNYCPQCGLKYQKDGEEE